MAASRAPSVRRAGGAAVLARIRRTTLFDKRTVTADRHHVWRAFPSTTSCRFPALFRCQIGKGLMTGRALRSVRLALSLTIPEFSERIGIPADEVDACERGEEAIEPARLSSALERLAPDVHKLQGSDPLLFIPPLPSSLHSADCEARRVSSRAAGGTTRTHVER